MEDKLLFTVREARALLGISRSLFYKLIGTGAIPVVRLGGAVRVSRAALERLTEQPPRDQKK
ncbi:MAG: hypothetical protein DDT37_01995 [Firmicutes bacterium]|nr:hypothetical protein [candidate division NPL-UPA2 bacterium]